MKKSIINYQPSFINYQPSTMYIIMPVKIKHLLLGILFLGVQINGLSQTAKKNLTIGVSFAKEIQSSVSKDGRLLLFFTQNPNVEPREMTWPYPWSPCYIFAKNFSDINLNKALVLNDFSDWTQSTEWSLDNIPEGEYYVQCVWYQNTDIANVNAPGNYFGEKQKVSVSDQLAINMTIDQVIPERTIVENELARMVDFKSDTLSKWWGRPVSLKASVLLPSGYDANKEYAIRYNVAGYGGRYDRVNRLLSDAAFMDWWNLPESPQVINVYLDGEGPFGDSYHMDSENSGPHGYALVYELIPHIEKTYRGTNTAKNRFIDGCSTGGWVSLGLQLYYPDFFDGVFSYSPDAVDFENYQLIDIYKDQNAFINETGYLRPVMRDVSGEPWISMKDFVKYENVLGRSNTYLDSGGQFSAHAALYSPKGANGLPIPLFDPLTGKIDSEVAEYWKKYDFKIYLEENWETLGPKIAGKIYIWMGDMDHFYLNPATRSLDETFDNMVNPSSDAMVVFSAMEGHCSMFSDRIVLEKIQEKLDEE